MKVRYKLAGLISHRGPSPSGGLYVVEVRAPDGQWCVCSSCNASLSTVSICVKRVKVDLKWSLLKRRESNALNTHNSNYRVRWLVDDDIVKSTSIREVLKPETDWQAYLLYYVKEEQAAGGV